MEAVVAFTESGGTARLISKYRPRARIIGFTPNMETFRRMAILWGVEPQTFERLESTDEMIAAAERILVERGISEPGDRVAMAAGVPPNRRASTNLLKLHVVP
jgi:pyruvate kinase